MVYPRRSFLGLLTAGLATACTAPAGRSVSGRPLDTARLSAEFPALADRAAPAAFDLGVMSLPDGVTWIWRQEALLPLQSLFKAPLAAAVLAQVDARRLRLNQALHLTPTDLSAPGGLINTAWPKDATALGLSLPLADLIALTIQQSDNTAADTLMLRIGGPEALTAWLRSKAIPDMRVDRYERQLQQDLAGMGPFQPDLKDEAAWLAARSLIPASVRETAMDAFLNDPRDTTSVTGALDFLAKLDGGVLLSPNWTRLLLHLMTANSLGTNLLAAGLPAGARIAHKAGASRTDLGLTPATNDMGIVTLPGGRRFAVAAFLARSTATESTREQLLADAARLVAACL